MQLEAKHSGSLTLPPTISAESPTASATKLLALIKEFEGGYQDSLSNTYHEMGEKSFKSLRRALPLTRQKLDWDKVSSSRETALFLLSHCSYLSKFRFWDTNLVKSFPVPKSPRLDFCNTIANVLYLKLIAKHIMEVRFRSLRGVLCKRQWRCVTVPCNDETKYELIFARHTY